MTPPTTSGPRPTGRAWLRLVLYLALLGALVVYCYRNRQVLEVLLRTDVSLLALMLGLNVAMQLIGDRRELVVADVEHGFIDFVLS